MEEFNNKIMFRQIEINNENLNEEERTLVLSASSENPVQQYFGFEILEHSQTAVSFQRLKSGMPVCWNHNTDIVIGVVVDSWIDAEQRKLYVRVRFAKNSKANEIYNDILDGIIRNVSIGYSIDKIELESDVDGVKTYRVKRWTPYEVSMVSVPADITVGVGRSMQVNNDEQYNNIQINSEEKMDEKVKQEVEALGKRHKLPYQFALESNMTVEQYRAFVLENIETSQPVSVAAPVTTPAERERYSIIRAINSAMTGANCFEREISNELVKRSGVPVNNNSIRIPFEVAYGKRDLSAGGSGTGAEFLTGEYGDVIEALRPKLLADSLGVNVTTVEGNQLRLPKLGKTTFGWRSTENAAVSESTPTTSQLSLTAKSGGTYVDISKALTKQSSYSVENLIMNALVKDISVGINTALLNGSGSSGQPTGIINTSGVGSVTISSMTYAKAVEFVSDVIGNDVTDGKFAFVTTPTVWGTLKTRSKETGYPDYIIDANDNMAGYKVNPTTMMPSGTILFGDFSKSIIVLFNGVDITVDPYTLATNGLIRVVADQFADIGVFEAGAFSVGSSFS